MSLPGPKKGIVQTVTVYIRLGTRWVKHPRCRYWYSEPYAILVIVSSRHNSSHNWINNDSENISRPWLSKDIWILQNLRSTQLWALMSVETCTILHCCCMTEVRPRCGGFSWRARNFSIWAIIISAHLLWSQMRVTRYIQGFFHSWDSRRRVIHSTMLPNDYSIPLGTLFCI